MPEPPERIAAFSSYVPQAVLRHVVSTGTPQGETGGPHADRFPAALLLVDLTGFTQLTASAVRRGAAGTEQLSRSLNAYLGQIIDLVADHGGDIAKIVGDALLPVWPAAVDEELPAAARRAVMCGLAISTELGELELEDDLRLSLKVGLCAGEVAATHVGGLEGRWLFLVAGDGVSQLSALEEQMRTGGVVASPQAWHLIADRFVGQPLDGGHVRVRPTQHEAAPRALAPVAVPPERESSVRAYIPSVVLSRLDAGQADWLAELRRTTVIFAGVRGIASATPDAVQLLQRVTLAAQRALARYDGWLKEVTMDDKGTTLVAAFGVPPFTHEDDPARALEAAVAIQSGLREVGLSAGIGVATGTTFCGPVGNERRRDFAVLGQHVNLAARLMQAAGADGVLCDTETHDAVRGRRILERLPAYVLKGMTSPIDVYRVRPADAAAERPSVMIDRTSEMAAASARLEALKAGDGGMVVLEGEPGIGKSRLVDEWLQRAQESGVRTVVGAAAQIEGATPYHAWRPIFERFLGLDGVAGRAARSAIVLDRLSSHEASLPLAPLLDPILSLDLPETEITAQLSGEVRADNTRDVLVRLVRAEAAKVPLMIVLEDAHWLDSASWSLVSRVRREVRSVLLVLTMRPVAAAASDPIGPMRGETTTMRLTGLSPEDAVALACERTGASRIADAVAAVVEHRAEGNPLFIEQLTYAMRDSGRIVVDNGLVRATSGIEELERAIIPDTVQRVITARLDQLPPAEAMTLKVASVIGPRFALRTLRDIYPLAIESEALVDHLGTLTRLDLVAPTPSAPEPTYEFRHVITQEVAYNVMLSAQSQQLHRSLAEWHERTYAADLAPFHAFLAHHWRSAGSAARAIDHLEAAGAQALRTFANDEAIGFLEQALSLADEAGLRIDPPRQARWQLQIGEAHVNTSRYRRGRDHLEIGLRLMKQSAPAGQRQQVTWLLGELGRQALRRGGLVRGVRPQTDAQREELVAVCRAYERLAEASYYGGEQLLPLYCTIRILNEAEASGSAPEIARGFAGTGALFGLVPRPRIAEWYLRRALERLGNVDDLATHEIAGIVVGFYYVGAAKWDQAREQFRTVRRIARRLGDRRRFEDAVVNLMETEYLQGNFRTASQLADELIAAASDRNDHRFWAEGLAGKAYAAWQLGDVDDAVAALGALKAKIAEQPELTDEVRIKASGLLAMISMGRGDPQQAQAASDEAMRLTAERPTYFGTMWGYVAPAELHLGLAEVGQSARDGRERAADALRRLRRYAEVFPIGRPRLATLEGRGRWLNKRPADAFRSWRRALALAQALSMPYEEGLAHYEIGRHLQAGDPERASHLEHARQIFGRLEASQALSAVETDAVAAIA